MLYDKLIDLHLFIPIYATFTYVQGHSNIRKGKVVDVLFVFFDSYENSDVKLLPGTCRQTNADCYRLGCTVSGKMSSRLC